MNRKIRRELRKDKNLIKELYSIIVKYLPGLLNMFDNLEINDMNIKNIVILGRNRWKIENQGFYNQKHRIFDITHLNSRNDTAMKNHYFFIQFAHTIRQLLEQGSLLIKSLKLKIKEVSEHLLNALTSAPSDLNNIETKFQLRFDT